VKPDGSISEERKKLLDEICADPVKLVLLRKMAAHWKGAVFRHRCCLSNVLNRLQFSNLRGTLVYAHGSGGCSWDNFRICRMIAGMGFLVVAPDGFAYPKNTAMGQMRHKDILPLKKADDDTNYWSGDLMYASGSSGTATYSTKADSVLEDPDHYRELYEKAYQLRRSELHFTIRTLPLWIKTKGFFIGGTSEGAMTVARFDDQRYGDMVCGRFINSFSVEYCYFTPTPEDGEIGGQLKVPTLNIIGTKDQFFGAEDSVAKIVADDEDTGYGAKHLTGHGYNTFWKQGLTDACVCLLENGVHSPCNTHDNFLRQLFDVFFSRPHDIWELDKIWSIDPTMAELVELKQTTREDPTPTNVTQVFVPKMKFPQKMSLREVQAMRMVAKYDEKMKAEMEEDEKKAAADQAEAKAMLDSIRKSTKKAGGKGFAKKAAKDTYYSKGEHKTKKEIAGTHVTVSAAKKK
jgi:predicted alpha/beta-hydrolase family hydrolase